MHEGSAQRPQSPPEPHHNPALDGIRGLAILCVLGHHLVYINSSVNTPLYIWARALRDSLWSGVDIFFALSGFLITGILVRTLDAPGYFRNFYGRRTLRIFPLYYMVLLIILACTHWLRIHWGSQIWRLLTYSNHPFPPLHSSQWSFYFGGYISLVNFWSLHIEEQFYFFWPFLIFFFRRPRRLLAVAGGLSLFSIALRIFLGTRGVSYIGLYSSLASRVDSLLIGASLALLLYTNVRHRVLRAAPVLLSIFSLLLAIIFFTHRGLLWEHASPTLFSLQFTLISLCATALIAVCLDNTSPVSRLFSTPVLRFFGKYSYGMYIYHSILPMFYMSAFLSLIAPLAHHPAIQHLLTTLVELTTTIIVSVLSFDFVESRFLRLKRYFSYRVPEAKASVTESHALS
ncbi:MAG TPA: acyltransferase [Candidatus Aquilonibacter sp.]|nr:acyltransferase [Candidatus Aquilonibacter sp.]